MTSGIYSRERMELSKCRGPTLEETWPDHAIRRSVAITKLPLGRDIRKKKMMKNK